MRVLILSILFILNINSALAAEFQKVGGKWRLQQINGERPIHDDVSIVFAENENIVRGSGGCNKFDGVYSARENNIRINESALSSKICDKIEHMQLEDQFFVALSSVQSYVVRDNNLEFYNQNGSKIASFARDDASFNLSKLLNDNVFYRKSENSENLLLTFDW